MNRLFTITFLFCLLAATTQAQRYAELGGFFGIANYQGDLANRPVEFRETKYSFGGFAKYHYANKLHFRAQLYYARISGDDVHAPDPGIVIRNWRFTSDLAEASIQMEWLPFAKYRFNKVGLFRPQINPFLSIGIGSSFAINKTVEWQNSGLDFSRLGIKFPEEDDKDNFLIIPVGGGIRFDVTQWTTFAAEAGWRYANSDHLDGVSANGDGLMKEPGDRINKDWYFFMGFTLSTYIGEQEDFGL
ncbi:MAG: DUF6089 family protein [Bacteroidota bacterium]